MNRLPLSARPLLLVALAALAWSSAAPAGAFTLLDHRVIKMSTGDAPPADGPSATSTRPRYSVSEDGCWVVFTSEAKNILSSVTDGNSASDVFLFDACSSFKVVAVVSHADSKPNLTANGRSDQPVISPDGSFVVFRSTASDIVPDPIAGASYTGQTNVFLWEKATDTFQLASHAMFGATWAANRDSQNGVISRNGGRPYVAFESIATDILESDSNDVSDVFRFNSSNGAVTRVSGPNFGLPPPTQANGGSFNPAIDGSGNCIVYESEATNLVSDKTTDDLNGPRRDVFRWNTVATPVTILLSHIAGAPNAGTGALTGDGESTEASIADNCEMFAFKSAAKDLISPQNEGNGGTDIFHARNGGDAVLVSHVDAFDTDTGSDVSDSPILSRDGNWIAFRSLAKDLAPNQNDSGSSSDVFLYDIAADKTTLVSHASGDPKSVASGESFAPDVSKDGRYVAFESLAKDLDPNQNDGNGKRDVFLYNRTWNSSVMASPRYASIAVAGKEESFGPAVSGLAGAKGVTLAFTSTSGDLVADDPETGGLADAFVAKVDGFFPFLSVRSTASANVVEWATPPADYNGMELFVGATCPATYSVAGSPISGAPVPAANALAQYADPGPYAPGTSRCYSIFAQRDTGAIQPGDAPTRTIVARTLESGTPVQWAVNLAGVASLAQVGIGAQNLVALANDGGVYGIARGPSGGTWSANFWPFRATQPMQGRPPVLSLAVQGSTRTTFLGSQDGRVYAVDADKGQGVGIGGALWYSTPVLGTLVQPGVAGVFTAFGGAANHLLVGARGGPNTFRALDPVAGGQRAGSPFSGGGFGLGPINGTASVDYARSQVYFASQEFTAGQPSLWCLKLTATGLGPTCWSPVTLIGSISGGPVERAGVVYVGTDAGQLRAYDAALGTANWAGPFTGCGGGNAVKSFVFADRLGTARDLYYSTSSHVCAATDAGTTVSLKWQNTSITTPSAPLLARVGGTAYVYVGGGDGRLYQIEADTPANVKSVLIRTGATVGAAAFDVRDNMLYVGTDAGVLYAVQAPIP